MGLPFCAGAAAGSSLITSASSVPLLVFTVTGLRPFNAGFFLPSSFADASLTAWLSNIL
jgi:hypothetical protein